MNSANSLLTDAAATRPRFVAIDALRGLVIILMALDHSRDFLGDLRIRPEAIETTTVALFFTRWFTHFCAPTFLFLAGVSAWMHGQKLGSRKDLSVYLIARGIWLVFLEFTVIYFGLMFSYSIGAWMFIVIAAIGSSMILLGLLCWLPHRVVLAIGLIIVCGHNLLDGVQADQFGNAGWIWNLLHQPGYIQWANVVIGYPLLPWLGVMAVGFGCGPFLAGTSVQRRRFAVITGLTLVLAFFALRAVNQYGDSQRWNWQTVTSKANSASETGNTAPVPSTAQTTESNDTDWIRSTFSFLTTSKYPPSLLFILMTIGPALLMLALLDWLGESSRLVRFLNVFGRVPLFFYILHFYMLHLGAWALYWIFKGVLISPMHIEFAEVPPEYGFNGPGWLWQVYIGWGILLALLFPLCIWYGAVKRRGKSKLWSYL